MHLSAPRGFFVWYAMLMLVLISILLQSSLLMMRESIVLQRLIMQACTSKNHLKVWKKEELPAQSYHYKCGKEEATFAVPAFVYVTNVEWGHTCYAPA